jgi:hypothetical protein
MAAPYREPGLIARRPFDGPPGCLWPKLPVAFVQWTSASQAIVTLIALPPQVRVDASEGVVGFAVVILLVVQDSLPGAAFHGV